MFERFHSDLKSKKHSPQACLIQLMKVKSGTINYGETVIFPTYGIDKFSTNLKPIIKMY